MNITEKAARILEMGKICDHCLGRQFAKLLSGYTNDHRGIIIRTVCAMKADSEGTLGKMLPSNFQGFKFHSQNLKKIVPEEAGKCFVCNGLFEKLDGLVNSAVKAAKGIEFSTFSVGTVLSSDILSREENLWEDVGLEYCEPIKSEINREIGRKLEKVLGKKADLLSPELNIIIDLNKMKAEIKINPLFVYGEYQKLARGIPQTKWPSGKYKTSVEQIIARPLMKTTKGKGHKFHGLGREDIDARCLGWRPFVIEILEPKKRSISLSAIEKAVNSCSKIKVRSLRKSDIGEVRKIKECRAKKAYSVRVICDREISKQELKKLNSLLGEIVQRTPSRVLHRRADLKRRRKVFSLRVRQINSRKFILYVETEAGLYIKELVTGDSGRTKPSVAQILGCKCTPKDLDVTRIFEENKF